MKRGRKDNLHKRGTKLEAENDREHLLYESTIHPVTYVGFDGESGKHKCKMSAFPEGLNTFLWEERELHLPRHDTGGKFKPGDHVQVRLISRGGVDEDGKWVEDLDNGANVWVNAIFVRSSVAPEPCLVEHINWNAAKDNFRVQDNVFSEKLLSLVSWDNIRKAYE